MTARADQRETSPSPLHPVSFEALQAASRSPRWLRLYQYEKTTFGGLRSDVTAPKYFFSPEGPHDPFAEMRAAIDAYQFTEKRFGIQDQAAACVFPARKRVLEGLLGVRFPDLPCTDLHDWKANINADQASLVFVGAYAGNPASILGHTFLRLSNSARERSGREGMDLLSYSIGFVARPDPSDGRMAYMLRGLTGGYPGSYEIEKHYMKVGLYNNSESRDLWDLPLNLTPAEVELLVLHLWELTFNAQMKYYFIDENCSYRLIKWLEAVRPASDVSARFPSVVLPSETVRAVLEEGWAEPTPRFRSSVRRRMEMKLALLSEDSRRDFVRARESTEDVLRLTDPTVLDALLDYWLYENYRTRTQLAPERKAIMEATYARAAEITGASLFQMKDEKIRESQGLEAPFMGHKPRWIEARTGASGSSGTAGLGYRSGVHPFWSADNAYAGIASVEYLGADLDLVKDQVTQWNALLIDARSIENFFGPERPLSWSFEAKATNQCLLCATDKPLAHAAGGVGLGTLVGASSFYLLAHADGNTWFETGLQGVLAPGLVAGAKFASGSTTLLLEGQNHWWKSRTQSTFSARLNYAWNRAQNVFLQLRTDSLTPTTTAVGFVRFF